MLPGHQQTSYWPYVDGLVQERHNSIASALELCLSCTNPSMGQQYFSAYKLAMIGKSPRSEVTLCFQFVSTASTSAVAKTFPSHVKLFQFNLWYLAQRIYGSGEMYWMTFPWPWPKVMAVASISKNLLVWAIKWELLIKSLQNVVIYIDSA